MYMQIADSALKFMRDWTVENVEVTCKNENTYRKLHKPKAQHGPEAPKIRI